MIRQRYCSVCKYWDGHDEGCPERAYDYPRVSPFDEARAYGNGATVDRRDDPSEPDSGPDR